MPKNARALFLIVLPLFTICISGDSATPDEIAPRVDGVIPFASSNEFTVSEDLVPVDPDYREKWTRLSGFEFSGLHWNHFVVVYVNQEADVYNANYFEYANHFAKDDWGFEEEGDDGPKFIEYSEKTVFLKEHFASKDGKPAQESFITTMEKMPEGYDPEYGDWRYGWADGVSGQLLQIGNSENPVLMKSCIECHSNMAERDYIFATVSRISN